MLLLPPYSTLAVDVIVLPENLSTKAFREGLERGMEEARQEREELQDIFNKIRSEILLAPTKGKTYPRLMQHIAWGELGES